MDIEDDCTLFDVANFIAQGDHVEPRISDLHVQELYRAIVVVVNTPIVTTGDVDVRVRLPLYDALRLPAGHELPLNP